MSAGVGAATGYVYVLPAGWLHLDPAPAGRQASVRRAVSQRVRREPRLAPCLAQLDRALLHECAVAAAQGAERVSLLAEPVDRAFVTAGVTFVVRPTPADSGAADAAAIAARLGAEPGAVADVQIVGLAQLPAVRRVWDAPAVVGRAPEAESLLSRQWQLLVPWPGRAQLGLLTLASPCRPLWPLLEQTFDACAQTFHWTWTADQSAARDHDGGSARSSEGGAQASH